MVSEILGNCGQGEGVVGRKGISMKNQHRVTKNTLCQNVFIFSEGLIQLAIL